jgi:hypothetical protein
MPEKDTKKWNAGPDSPLSSGMRWFLLLVSFTTLGSLAWAQKFSSGENRTHLLELYSSEGCSSCPPAEQWLGGLRAAPGLWRDFVPVAFHVTYWDNLGWPDRFARQEYTARQYAYSGQWGSDTVYTPGFVLDGAEWRQGSGSLPPAAGEKAGVLSVDYAEGGTCRVKFAAAGDYEIYAALLGGGIVSRVRAGENEGRTLQHDFVVLAMKTASLTGGTAELNLPKSAGDGVARYALAVWVVRRGELVPLQATGGWLE